jgi:acyl-coenzyme A synthetase/AMP-(fatty) acid ligase/acyl carrier protein
MLGILKAGKICVPIDPSLPMAMATHILEHCDTGGIIAGKATLSAAAALSGSGRQLIDVDELDPGASCENVSRSLSPEVLAFIMHTSGSTGSPKGVAQNHRNTMHWTLKKTNAFHACPEDRVALLGSLGSSQAKATGFLALLNGAGLYEFSVKKEGVSGLADWLIREEITIYASAATIFREFAATLKGNENLASVRLVKLGAEQVRKSDVEAYKKHFSPQCLFAVMLSSSETGSICQYFLDKESEISGETVPIGYAEEDVEVRLLDEAGEPVGYNERGEIAVRSRYLAPGYWRAPDLTAAKFLTDSEKPDQRTFLTGDMGRIRTDGCVEHVGRKDFRVKIRGFRVELEEIESTLRLHANIREAVVEARTGDSTEPCLTAYIVPRRQPRPTVSDLRRFVRERLPEHMMPSGFVLLDELPRAPNGKVDRKALPEPGRSRPELDTAFAAPGTPVETQLAGIWSDVLSLDKVGIHDNFFDLGGHSLAATRVIARVIERFQLELPVKALFDSPTVADMAAVITRNQANQAEQGDLARMLKELEALSDEDARRLIQNETKLTTTKS